MSKRMKANKFFWLIMMLIVFTLVGCSATERNSAEQTAEVELDIFSGRPNPTWSLSETETATLLDMLDGLTPVEPMPLPDNLGYRGFQVRLVDPQSAEPLTVRTHTTRIEVAQGDSVQQYADPESDVAWWLLDHAAETAVDNDLYEVVATELRQSAEPQ